LYPKSVTCLLDVSLPFAITCNYLISVWFHNLWSPVSHSEAGLADKESLLTVRGGD
jgi:hypothetical protein